MSWCRDDDDMLDNEKWRRALRDGGDSALLVWVRLRNWCSRRLTDGIVPADMVNEVAEIGRSKARMRALQALIEHGLCARDAHGTLTVCGYLDRNPSRAHVLAERERRSEAQRNRRHGKNVTGHAPSSEAEACSVPARPGPAPTLSNESVSAPALPEVPGLRIVAAQSRALTLPGPDPDPEYLAACVSAGVSREQALATWEHYWGAGLPPTGVQRLTPWLVRRAKERANQLAKAPPRGPIKASPKPGDDLDTTGAATAFRPSHEHRDYARANLPTWNLDTLAHEYRSSALNTKTGPERDRDFLRRLVFLKATGKWQADGELPRPRSRPATKEATA